jgi:hypothetical protein
MEVAETILANIAFARLSQVVSSGWGQCWEKAGT